MGVDGAQPLKRIRRTEPEIRHPPGQIAADIFHAGRDGPPPIRGRHLPHGSLQPLFRISGGKDGDVATLFQARMAPEKIDSLADDVKPLVLALLRQNSVLTARVDELVAQNKALLVRIAELVNGCQNPRKDGAAKKIGTVSRRHPLRAVASGSRLLP